ncbi:MAG TPA: BlaI/MecI/CopY family transcriptional regulator [Bryobacteraceae bacterium]|jgi:predicted transcriptional regulator
MKQDGHLSLSRRERQIMDILFQRGSAAASEILEALPDPPSYSAVRAALSVLEKKGHIKHELQALRYVWKPRIPRENARRTALRHLVKTFFDGSVEQTVAALLDEASVQLGQHDLHRLREMISKAEGGKL